MPLQITEMVEADFADMVRVEYIAYQDTLIERLLFPKGRTAQMLDMQEKNAIEEAREDRTVHNIKVVDTDRDNEPIAYARWRVYEKGIQSQQLSVNQKVLVAGADSAGSAIWRDVVQAKRKQHIGAAPHCYLSNIATRPEGQGRGAATMLIQWGCQVADGLGVPAYLQSILAGRQLYTRCGFEAVYEIDVDLVSVGMEGPHLTYLMARYPTKATSAAQRLVRLPADSI